MSMRMYWGGGGTARSTVKVDAVVYPACVCGRPWTEHKPAGTACGGYAPSRPVEQRGLRSYWSSDWRCRLLWAVEARLQGLRERLEGDA